MAARFQPSSILYLFFLFIISSVPQSTCQSDSPQNIETRYPYSPPPHPPPPPSNDQPISPPPTPKPIPSQPDAPPGKSSSKNAVAKAVAATAASTLVLSALLFFLLLRRSRRKRERTSTEVNLDAENPAVPRPRNDFSQSDGNVAPWPRNDFTRFDSNVKGVIVDENGLDVLYWRNLEGGEKKRSFKKQVYQNLKHDQENEEEKQIISGDDRNKKHKQETPLLRGKSSTSQSAVWIDKEDSRLSKVPTLSSGIAGEKQNSLSQVVKDSAPPAPRPPPTNTEAVPKAELAATAAAPPPPPVPVYTRPSPPPPPPVPSNLRPSPPLQPPPKAGGVVSSLKPPAPKGMPGGNQRSSSLGEGASSNENEKVKLKPLHWDKVNPNAKQSMVWDKIDQGSFKFDGDLMEALFGYVATNRKSPRQDSNSTSPRGDRTGPASRIFILDTRKSQNTAIVLKSLGVSHKEIMDALVNGDGLNADTLEKLTKISPTDEETSQILAFDGDPTRLADAESFLYHLLKAFPSAFTHFNAMLFRSNYYTEISTLKESLKSVESACNELRNRGLFLKLLEAVLKAGNRLNAGTSRGNAQAFNLTALRKLSDVKSSDGTTTLLQFVVQEVVRAEGKRCVLNRNRSVNRTDIQNTNPGNQSSDHNLAPQVDREKEYMMLGLPVIGGLSAEFGNVKKAATMEYDSIVKTSSGLSSQLIEIRKIVARCDHHTGFAKEMKIFVEGAEEEIKAVMKDQTRVMELVKKTTDYYQAGSSNYKGTSPLQLFVIVRDFLGMVDQVCVDIARNVQKKKPAPSSAGSSSTPESPRIFRFPKLPANFMSDHSKSSSSESDDE